MQLELNWETNSYLRSPGTIINHHQKVFKVRHQTNLEVGQTLRFVLEMCLSVLVTVLINSNISIHSTLPRMS